MKPGGSWRASDVDTTVPAIVLGDVDVERAGSGKAACRRMILEVRLAVVLELVGEVVSDDSRLVHDGALSVAVLVVKVERVADFVSHAAQVLLTVTGDGRVPVERRKCAALGGVPHAA